MGVVSGVVRRWGQGWGQRWGQGVVRRWGQVHLVIHHPLHFPSDALQSPVPSPLIDHPVIVQRASAFNPVVADLYGRRQGTYAPRDAGAVLVCSGLHEGEELHPRTPGAYQSNSYPHQLYDPSPTLLMAGGREGQFDYQVSLTNRLLKLSP